MSWILLWKIMFISVMAAFAVMACLVTFFGARDIKKLLKALDKDSKGSTDDGRDQED